MKLLFYSTLLLILMQTSVSGIHANYYDIGKSEENELQSEHTSRRESRGIDPQNNDETVNQKGNSVNIFLGLIMGAIIGLIIGHGSVIIRRELGKIFNYKVTLGCKSGVVGTIIGLFIGVVLANIGGRDAFVGSVSTIIAAVVGGVSTIIAAIIAANIALLVGGRVIMGKKSNPSVNKNFYDIMDTMLKTTTDIWSESRFERLKNLTPFEVSRLGEKFLYEALLNLEFHAQRNDDRHAEWSVMVNNFKIQVKVAHLSKYKLYQFNNIRPESDFTHLFLLGVSPMDLYFKIISKDDIGDYILTPMARMGDSYKLTLKTEKLQSLDEFEIEIEGLFGVP